MHKLSFIIIFIIVFSSNTVVGQTSSQNNKTPDPIASTVSYLKKELNLDAFQEAAVKVYVKENIETNQKIDSQDIAYEGKLVKYEQAAVEFDEKVSKILNPEQLKKFQELQEQRKNKKGSKKKKEKKNTE